MSGRTIHGKEEVLKILSFPPENTGIAPFIYEVFLNTLALRRIGKIIYAGPRTRGEG